MTNQEKLDYYKKAYAIYLSIKIDPPMEVIRRDYGLFFNSYPDMNRDVWDLIQEIAEKGAVK